MKVSIRLSGPGWANTVLTDEQSEVDIRGSHISDALGELLQAVRLIISGSSQSSCRWENEPGETRLFFTREGNQVRVKASTFDSSFSRTDYSKGIVIFEGIEGATRFGSNIKQQFDRLLYEHGESGYHQGWGYSFPIEELKLLSEALNPHE